MVAQPKHGRRLVLSGVALTMGQDNDHSYEALVYCRNRVESALIENKFFYGAPFSWIGLSIRYGIKNDEHVQYIDLDEKDGELALAIEIDTHDTLNASFEKMKNIIGIAVLKSVIQVGEKYDRPIKPLVKIMAGLPDSLKE